MTPGQTRVLMATFLVVLAGAAVNALLLQPKSRSSTLARTTGEPSRGPDRPIRIAAATQANGATLVATRGQLKPDAALSAALPEPTTSESGDVVRAVQRELTARGYGGVTVDGTINLRTRAAIMAYEFDQHLPVTGLATDALLQRLVMGTTSDPADASSAPRKDRAEQVVRHVQQTLARLGYAIGRPDGRAGEDLVRAIRDFELDQGLVPSGRVSADLLAAIERRLAALSARQN
jgi:peptidoglycan hydrolase-like protein with peptidoglycan-binding domain